jgi:hypothetical protein
VERTVYEEVLPRLPLTRPAYYGSAPAGERWSWILLEEIRRTKLEAVRPSAFFLLRAFDRSQDHGLSACRFIKRAEREEQSYCAHYGGS